MAFDPREVRLTLRIITAEPKAALFVEFKTFEFFRATLRRMVQTLYDGWIGGEFIETMGNLITGQLIRAHIQAWVDEGNEGDPPLYLQLNAQRMVDEQIGHIQPYYAAILEARINQTSVAPLLVRADMWANRYNEAYNDALVVIAQQNGGKLEWIYDPSKEHCDTCAALNGIVAYAREWEVSGFKPQNAPNNLLDCGGWQCGCELRITDKRKTPKALDRLINIAVSRTL